MFAIFQRARKTVFLILSVILVVGPHMQVTSSAQERSTGKTVNLELIVDSSGSMAAATSTGELRIDAAKRVLTQVISEIPNVEGVNVGFRVYGHRGNNTDAGRPESCLSSDLTVPIEGINTPALIEQVNALQPTGWTPLGYSLQQAANDFTQPAGENVVNAIVMVTDGLETCDGDPVAIAGELKSSSAAVTTHVIGFGTTPEEQAILQGIADSGGGQLLGAANASELSAALFDVLEELEVVQGVGFIGGNAIPLMPQGDVGELSVIAVGAYDGNVLPIVVRNNTGQDVIRITAIATAKNPSGQVIASGGDQMFKPNLVRSGGISIGYAYFAGIELPADTTFDIQLDSTPATEDRFENARDLEVVEASTIDGRIVGTLRNIYDAELSGPFSVSAVCFDEAGSLLSHQGGFIAKDRLSPDETVTFQVDNFTGQPCPLFLVAGSGWDDSFGPNNSVEPPSDTTGATEEIETTPQAEASTTPSGVATPADRNAMTCADLSSPESILTALQAAGLPIGEYEVYSAETDPNMLLGRPLQYTGKLNFMDTRIVPLINDFSTTNGGSIEVFASPEDAQARNDYILSVIRANPSLTEYLYLEGSILVRISANLTPDQANAYNDALKSIVSCK